MNRTSKQRLGSVLVALAAAAALPALGAEGFYGGIARRDVAGPGEGLIINDSSLAWGRFGSPAVEDQAQRSLVFGGFRRNDVSLEAAFNSGSDKYALRPPSLVPGGVGLGLANVPTRLWNADVYTTWDFTRSFSLYGRMGYAQNDARSLLVTQPIDPRRNREGMNYGVGLRYDVNQSLGLRFEYARFGRLAAETALTSLPDSDQLSVGVQLRF